MSQSEARVERYVRSGEKWILTEFVGLEADFSLEKVEVSVPVSSIYARVDLLGR